jgi:hypothetical protein
VNLKLNMKQHKIVTSHVKINQLWNITMTNISINLLFYPKPLPELLTMKLNSYNVTQISNNNTYV